MTDDMFWQIYVFAMVIVFAILPFSIGGGYYRTIWEVTHKNVGWALLIGVIPIINWFVAACLILGLITTCVWDHIFNKDWWNLPVLNRRKSKEK